MQAISGDQPCLGLARRASLSSVAHAAETTTSSSGPATTERLGLLVEAVEEYAIFMLDPDGTVATWNTGAHRIKGYVAEEIVGRHFSVFYTDEEISAGEPQRELDQAKAEGRARDEGWRVRKDGSRFWANVVITAVYDKSGRLEGFAKVTRDETSGNASRNKLAYSRFLPNATASRTSFWQRSCVSCSKRFSRWKAPLRRRAIRMCGGASKRLSTSSIDR
jgi:PAS domain S-box-containing protein